MRAAKHSGGKSEELVRTREKGREGSPLAGRRRKFGVAQGAKKKRASGHSSMGEGAEGRKRLGGVAAGVGTARMVMVRAVRERLRRT